MTDRNKIYFASDLHLGSPDWNNSLIRETHFVNWLQSIRGDAAEIYLLGDMFDFWFEYKRAVPKGGVRLLGKLAEFADSGIVIHYFVGNHDLWLRDYFQKELGFRVYYNPLVTDIHGRRFYLHHGDGLGPGDASYKFLKRIFKNRFFQWVFRMTHPDLGIAIASWFSKRSRIHANAGNEKDYGDGEYHAIHARNVLQKNPGIDYFVFGHRHIVKFESIAEGKYHVNLGDWMVHFTYLESTKDEVAIRNFGPPGIAAVNSPSSRKQFRTGAG